VHLNVQAQEPLWPHDWSTDDFVALYEQREATPSRRPRMEPASVFAPIRASLKKTRGLILAGPMDGVRMNTSAEREQLRASTRELSEQLGFPVLADPCSQLRTSSADHVIGSYDIFLRSDRFQEEAGPDVVVTMGEWPTSKVLGQFIERHQPTVISLQEDQNLRDPWDVVTHQVRVPYTQLTAVLADDSSEKPSGSGEWLALWKQADELAQKAADGDSSESLWEGAIARELVASLAAGTVLHVGSSMPIRNLDAFMDVCPDDCPVFSSRGANGIDGTIATAAGEAAGSGRNVLAWMGDLTFLHDAGSLAWIAGDTPLTILVTDNGGGGIFEHLPIATNDDVFEPYFITPPTASVSDVARGYGWEVETVDTTTALRDSLTESRGRRKVIVARVDRQENMTHYKSLWQRASGELDTLFGRTTPR
jgi:2-succinyl-5-enolpyruvyl-6-hydroxy-3-cyclohexene-1-carboxylate synthase